MNKRKYPGPPAKVGRVGAEQTFKPAVRKRRLVSRTSDDINPDAELAIQAGLWLKELRENRGLTLTELAKQLGRSKANLSMTEAGKTHLSPTLFEPFAEATGLPARDFVKKLLSYYAPEVYQILLKDEESHAPSA